MAAPQTMNLYLFGDQTTNYSRDLQELFVAIPEDPLLRTFYEAVDKELQQELQSLPKHSQKELGPRISLRDLILEQQQSVHPAFHPALLCFYQLGSIIRECSHEGDGGYFTQSGVYLLGLCTGALTAAAVACSRSVTSLIPVATHTTRVALRAGLRSYQLGQSIETTFTPQPWTLIISGISETAVEQLLNDSMDPGRSTARPYMSMVGERSISISGPPSSLDHLRSHVLLAGKSFRLKEGPVYAPFHASHLFGPEDIRNILAATDPGKWTKYHPLRPIISPASGRLLHASDLPGLLSSALEDMLLHPIRWDHIISSLIYQTSFTSNNMTLAIYPVGCTAAPILAAALQQRGSPSVEIRSEPTITMGAPESIDLRTPSGKDKIAIVGVSGRFPGGANDLEALWGLLRAGRDVHSVVPPSRWDVSTHVDVTRQRKNTSSTGLGCWLDNPAGFDARFFAMSPREARQVDPASRLALMTAYEAMETAGMVPGATPSTQRDRVGVFYGVTSNDWMEVNSAQDIDTYFIPGGCRAFIPGRINYCFQLTGPSASLDTACSSSLSSLHTACNALWQRDIDTAIAGGTNVLTNPDYTAGLDRGHFLSRTGNCKPFDAGADGYCRGEAVCTLVLKRLEDALADSDPIHGVILGAATNHSAEAESITRPHAPCQKAVFERIMRESGVAASDVDYVEMHGTGTQAGDITEMQSVLETFAPTKDSRRPDQPLYLGSCKANIGHGEAASGVTSLAKALLMLRHGVIPPHCGIKTTINPLFPSDLQERQVFINREPVAWPAAYGSRRPRRIFVNNFSAAGGNSAVLIEGPPTQKDHKENEVDSRTSHIVVVSAKSTTALCHNAEALLGLLDSPQGNKISLPALSYTTTTRRAHHLHRIAIAGPDLPTIRSNLHQSLQDALHLSSSPTVTSPVAKGVLFAFTGNGTQFPGMGEQMYDSLPAFKEHLERLDQLLQRLGYPSILSYCKAPLKQPAEFSPWVVQVATICLEIALARCWMAWGVEPDAVIGHSLGEYAALHIAGVLSEADTLYLTARRATLLEETCSPGTHAMLAVAASKETIAATLASSNTAYHQAGSYELACVNGPSDVVLSGRKDDLRIIQTTLTSASSPLKTAFLSVPYAFHSSQVDPILAGVRSAAANVRFHAPRIPVLSPLRAKVVREAGIFNGSYLADHCRQQVNIVDTLHVAQAQGVLHDASLVLEIGPQPLFVRMVAASLSTLSIPVFPSMQRGQDVWQLVTAVLQHCYRTGFDLDWTEYHRNFPNCHRVVTLPAYCWDLKDYWIQYVNDWSLRKGEPSSGPCHCQVSSSNPALSATRSVPPIFCSTSIHRVVECQVTDGTGRIHLETNLNRPDLAVHIEGHRVEGIPLCTPSVYAELALAVGTYIQENHLPPQQDRFVEIANLVIEKALIPSRGSIPHLLETIASVDILQRTVYCRFVTHAANGTQYQHSTCTVNLGGSRSACLQVINPTLPSVTARILALRQSLDKGSSFRFNRSMIYRMVGGLAQFDPHYQSLEEIILDSATMDASSVVACLSEAPDATGAAAAFALPPAFIDALSQSAGFIMNGNDHAALDHEVFVNHGWRYLRMLEPLDPNKRYRTYIKMIQQPEPRLWEGDLVVFDVSDDRPVAQFAGITLQGLPRRLFSRILQKEQGLQCPGLPLTSVSNDTVLTEENNIISHLTAKQEPSSEVFELQPSQMKRPLAMAAMPPTPPSGSPPALQPVALPVSPLISEFRTESIDGHFNALPSTNDYASSSEAATLKVEKALQILSEESGLAREEMHETMRLADLGFDSLLSLMVSGRCREELHIELEDIFVDGMTIIQFKEAIYQSATVSISSSTSVANRLLNPLPTSISVNIPKAQVSSSVHKRHISPTSPTVTTPASKTYSNALQELTTQAQFPQPHSALSITPIVNSAKSATSVLLHGHPRSARQTLILFPDGSGSPSAYAALGRHLRRDFALIALICPYHRHPADLMDCSLDALMISYLVELRRRQPTGPYNLGGWSSGGILAYRAAQLLIQAGETVGNLLLLDAPPPSVLEPLPSQWYEHCLEHGVFGPLVAVQTSQQGRKVTRTSSISESQQEQQKNLLLHFRSNIDVLCTWWQKHQQQNQIFPPGFIPRIAILWAGECVFDGVKRPRLQISNTLTAACDSDAGVGRGIRFLTEKRTDPSAGDWERLLLPECSKNLLGVETWEGVDHFAMMHEDNGKRLASFVESSIL